MLEALGSRLEQLSVTYSDYPEPTDPDSLLPAILMRCPRLRQLSFDLNWRDPDYTVRLHLRLPDAGFDSCLIYICFDSCTDASDMR
jgi:hypothetical protein